MNEPTHLVIELSSLDALKENYNSKEGVSEEMKKFASDVIDTVIKRGELISPNEQQYQQY
jgi:heterodisulfide reductase subunit C